MNYEEFMDFDEFQNLKELKPGNLVEGRYYYLTVRSQNIKFEKALFVKRERSRSRAEPEYFFKINGKTVLDSAKNGMFENSNGGYWHVYKINPKFSYISDNELKTLFTK
jgi:hypothetical protein